MLPFVIPLLTQGLTAVANAALSKGTDYIKERTGVDVTAEIGMSEQAKLRALENDPELRKLLVEDNRIQAELETARLAAETAQRQAVEATAQLELQSADAYVRRTRPKMARWSFYAGMLYALSGGIGSPLANQYFGFDLPAADPTLLGLIFSPALTFAGVRSVEAFSRGGKK